MKNIVIFIALFTTSSLFCMQNFSTCLLSLPEEVLNVGIGFLNLGDIANLKRCCKSLNIRDIYSLASDSTIKSASFDFCSKLIISAAHNKNVECVKKFMANNYEERIEALKIVGLPKEDHSGEDLLRILQGKFEGKDILWPELHLGGPYYEATHATIYTFICDVMARSTGLSLFKVKDDDGRTLVHWILMHNFRLNTEQEKFFASNDWTNVQDFYGNTPLHLLCMQSNFPTLNFFEKSLASKITNPNIINCDGDTALHKACSRNEYVEQLFMSKIIEILSEITDLGIRNKTGETALSLAYKNDNWPATHVLLKQHFIGSNDEDKKNVLQEFCSYPWDNLVDIWNKSLDNGLKGKSCHYIPSTQAMINCIYLLVSEIKKFNIMLDITNNDGDTLLHVACKDDNIKVVKHVLENNFIMNLNAKNRYGDTALQVACQTCSFELIQLLCNSPQIDLNVQNNNKVTPLYTVSLRYDDCLTHDVLYEFLSSQGKKMNFQAQDIYTMAYARDYKSVALLTIGRFKWFRDVLMGRSWKTVRLLKITGMAGIGCLFVGVIFKTMRLLFGLRDFL